MARGIWHLTLAVTALAASSHGADAAQVSFQGLGGDATVADVLHKFPNATHKNQCMVSQTILRSRDGNFECDALEVADYKVGDTAFRAVFLFRPPSKRLGQVYLMTAFGSGPDSSVNRMAKAEIDSLFIKWRDLLALKYGVERGPLYGFPGCLGLDNPGMYILCARWQGRLSKDWDDSEGVIELSVDGNKSKDESAYEVNLSVTYNLPDLSAAAHL